MVRISEVVFLASLAASVHGFRLDRTVDDALVRVKRGELGSRDRTVADQPFFPLYAQKRHGEGGLASLTGKDGGLKRETAKSRKLEAANKRDDSDTGLGQRSFIRGASHLVDKDGGLRRGATEDRSTRYYRPEKHPFSRWSDETIKRSGDDGLSALVDGGLNLDVTKDLSGRYSRRYENGLSPNDKTSKRSGKDGGLKLDVAKAGAYPFPYDRFQRSRDKGLSAVVDGGLKRESAKDASNRRHLPYNSHFGYANRLNLIHALDNEHDLFGHYPQDDFRYIKRAGTQGKNKGEHAEVRDANEKEVPGRLEAELYSLDSTNSHSKRTNSDEAEESDSTQPQYGGSAFNFYSPS